MQGDMSILGLTGRNHSVALKRARDLDGSSEMDWVDEGSGKRVKKP